MDKNCLYFAWSYPAEKFDVAMDALAMGFGKGWERMLGAVMAISHLLPSHFPDEDLYVRSKAIVDWASEFGPLKINGRNYYGSFENTLRKRKRSTLERYAREFKSIKEEIASRRGDYQYD